MLLQPILSNTLRAIIKDNGQQSVDQITADGSINWGKLSHDLDWIDLMSFDIHGEFDAADSKGTAQSATAISSINDTLKIYFK